MKAWTEEVEQTSGSTLSMNLPPAGDGENAWRFDPAKNQQIVLAVGSSSGSSSTAPRTPSGFTAVVPPVVNGSGTTLAVYRRPAVAGDEGKAVSVTFADSVSVRLGIAAVIEGADEELNGTPVSRSGRGSDEVSAGGMSLTQAPGLVLQAAVLRRDSTGTMIDFEVVAAGDAVTPDTFADGYRGARVSSTSDSTRNAALVLGFKRHTSGIGVPATVFPATNNSDSPYAAVQFGYVPAGVVATPDPAALPQWEVQRRGRWVPAVLEVKRDGVWR